jgi:hypothetical protein
VTAPTITAVRASSSSPTSATRLAHTSVLTRVRGRDPLELLGGEKGAAGFDQLAVALFVSMFARPPLEVGVEGPQEGEERRQREQLL